MATASVYHPVRKPKSSYHYCIERHYPHGLGPCTYCGDMASCLDHVVPYKLTKFEAYHWVVPACQSCNLHLSDRMLHSVPLRARYLAKAVRKANRLALRSALWDVDELEELGEGLASHVAYEMGRVGALEDRLKHLDMIGAEEEGYCQPHRFDEEGRFCWPRSAFRWRGAR